MIIKDRIYGHHTITSPVLLELIASKSMQRLKGIGQMGQPKESDPRRYKFSRYAHSIGVMLLLKILGASGEEQIAGLLHDVSHTAFSHTIDSVLKHGREQGYQDSQHERYIMNSDIPPILQKYGFSVSRIHTYKHFTLLERKLPALCADRVDYSLRESPQDLTRLCLPVLTSFDNRIVFTDSNVARVFADRFLVLQRTSWGGEGPVIREQLFTKALQHALRKKIISLEDFWKDDAFLMKKLKKAKDPYIEKMFKTMRHTSFTGLRKKSYIVKWKFRYVDPDILTNGRIMRLSQIDSAFYQKLKDAEKENEEGIRIPIVGE